MIHLKIDLNLYSESQTHISFLTFFIDKSDVFFANQLYVFAD